MRTRGRFHRLTGWSIPSIYVMVTVAVGLILPRWDSNISINSAIAITSSIASGMIALTGIVFSLVFVMVQKDASVADRQGLGIGDE